jgi:hypothetical protein
MFYVNLLSPLLSPLLFPLSSIFYLLSSIFYLLSSLAILPLDKLGMGINEPSISQILNVFINNLSYLLSPLPSPLLSPSPLASISSPLSLAMLPPDKLGIGHQ